MARNLAVSATGRIGLLCRPPSKGSLTVALAAKRALIASSLILPRRRCQACGKLFLSVGGIIFQKGIDMSDEYLYIVNVV